MVIALQGSHFILYIPKKNLNLSENQEEWVEKKKRRLILTRIQWCPVIVSVPVTTII